MVGMVDFNLYKNSSLAGYLSSECGALTEEGDGFCFMQIIYSDRDCNITGEVIDPQESALTLDLKLKKGYNFVYVSSAYQGDILNMTATTTPTANAIWIMEVF